MKNFRVSVGITISINYGRGYILLTSMEDTRKNNPTVTWLNLTLLSVTINEYGAINNIECELSSYLLAL